jgi:hypothetical protein
MHFAYRHMKQDTRTRKGKDSPAYLDPQMMTMTVIQIEKVEVGEVSSADNALLQEQK